MMFTAVPLSNNTSYFTEASTTYRGYFGSGTGPIWLNRVDCFGNEDTIFNCSHSETELDFCRYYGDAGVICRGNMYKSTVQSRLVLCTYVGCIHGEVSLVGGDSLSEGSVEICVNGTWVTVCEDSFDANDAVVICNQLGYPGLGSFVLKGRFDVHKINVLSL